MKSESELLELLDKFTDPSISQDERDEAEKILNQYPEKLLLYQKLIAGIQESRKRELIAYIRENYHSSESKATVWTWIRATVAIATFTFIVFITINYFMPGENLYRKKDKNKTANAQVKGEKTSEIKEIKSKEKIFIPRQKTEIVSENNDSTDDEDPLLTEEEDLFEIKEDLLVSDTLIHIISKRVSKDSTIIQTDTVQKSAAVLVEFWRSPLNYKGYKFNNKKLLLYGIKAPYLIRLLKLGEDVFLFYNGKIFLLTRDNEFYQYEEFEDPVLFKLLNN